MAIHSSILAWRIPWTGKPRQATVHGVTKSWTHWATDTHTLYDSTQIPNSIDIPCREVLPGDWCPRSQRLKGAGGGGQGEPPEQVRGLPGRGQHTQAPPTNTLTSSFQLHLLIALLLRMCGSNRITANNCAVGVLPKASCLGNSSIRAQLLCRGPGLYQPGKGTTLSNSCKDPVD